MLTPLRCVVCHVLDRVCGRRACGPCRGPKDRCVLASYILRNLISLLQLPTQFSFQSIRRIPCMGLPSPVAPPPLSPPLSHSFLLLPLCASQVREEALSSRRTEAKLRREMEELRRQLHMANQGFQLAAEVLRERGRYESSIEEGCPFLKRNYLY